MSTTGLSVTEVSFGYPGASKETITCLDWDFAPDSVTAITGASGCGKSTLLYLLGLMLTPTNGSIRLDGRSLGNLSNASKARVRASSIGFVFQDSALNPSRRVIDSVIEPALYRGDRSNETENRALTLLKRFGVVECANSRPGEISGGQAQRVAICRALINAPSVILADEPTGNLDPVSTSKVLIALQEAAEDGRTVVIATHDPAVTQMANCVLSLD